MSEKETTNYIEELLKPSVNKTYAGIGSRQTPPDILYWMTAVAEVLEDWGYCLYSGGADGADNAFEKGAGTNKKIFLPWRGFNGNNSLYYNMPKEAFEIASTIHPRWSNVSDGAKKLHARNCCQVLGADLKSPVAFVLCWHNGSGGTMQAVRLANLHNIPVINMAEEDWVQKLLVVVPHLLDE